MRPLILIALAASLAAPALPAASQHHAHAATQSPPTHPSTPATRFVTDAPLRKGMAGIRTAVGMLEHAEHGHLDAGQVRALADNIGREIAGIFAQCKLDRQADQALHGILARLGAGVQALKDRPQDATPAAKMRTALADYARLFDDPDLPPAP